MSTPNIRTIQVNLSADITNFQQNISRAERTIGSLGSELRNNLSRVTANTQLMLAQLGNGASYMDTLRVRSQGLGQSLAQQSTYVNRLQQELNTARTRFGDTSTEVRRLELQLIRAATAEQQMRNEMERLNHEMGLNARLNRFGQGLQGLQGPGMGLSFALTAPIAMMAKKGVEYNASMELAQVNMEVLLGDAKKASDLMSQFKTFAIQTPFQTSDLTQASITLMGYGMQLENIMPSIKMLGDISGGNREKLQGLALAFAQVAGMGRLMGTENRQMIQNGFAPLDAIAKKTGKSIAQLTQDMEDGKISAQMVGDAMMSATQKGGRFFQAMEKQSKTFSGQMSTLKENIDLALGALTKNLFELLTKQVIPALNNLTASVVKFSETNPELMKAVMTFALLSAALGPVLIGLGLLGSAITNITSAYTIVSGTITRVIAVLRGLTLASAIAAGETLILVGAVAALAAMAYVVYDNWNIVPLWFNVWFEAIKANFVYIADRIVAIWYYLKVKVYEILNAVAQKTISATAGMLSALSGIPLIGSTFAAAAETVRNTKFDLSAPLEAANKDLDSANAKFYQSTLALEKSIAAYDVSTSTLMDGFKNSFQKPFDTIKNNIMGLGQSMKNDLKIDDVIKGLGSSAKDTKNQTDKIEKELDKFIEKVKSKAEQYRDSLGLFEKASSEKISGERLFARLQNQLRIFDTFKASITSIGAKLGTGSKLYQDLLNRGPQAAGQIKAINALDTVRLKEYESLYNQKSGIATELGAKSAAAEMAQEKKLQQVQVIVNGGVVVENLDKLVQLITRQLQLNGVI